MTTETPPIVHEWWRCHSCRRVIGEVLGTQIVLKVRGEHVFLSATQWAARNCPYCGALNERDGRPESERRVTA